MNIVYLCRRKRRRCSRSANQTSLLALAKSHLCTAIRKTANRKNQDNNNYNIKDMTTANDSLKLAELLKTPICKMDGEELAFLITSITSNQQAQMLLTQPKQEEHNVYGIAGIAQIFGCSIPTASRIKKSGIINDAITQVGRKIVVNADKALELASKHKGNINVA